eukprot:2425543-Rhodomonas_salina.2
MQLQHCMMPFIVASPARWHQPASAMPSRSPSLPQELHVHTILGKDQTGLSECDLCDWRRSRDSFLFMGMRQPFHSLKEHYLLIPVQIQTNPVQMKCTDSFYSSQLAALSHKRLQQVVSTGIESAEGIRIGPAYPPGGKGSCNITAAVSFPPG